MSGIQARAAWIGATVDYRTDGAGRLEDAGAVGLGEAGDDEVGREEDLHGCGPCSSGITHLGLEFA